MLDAIVGDSEVYEFVCQVSVVVYEPTLDAPEFFGSKVIYDLVAFKAGCDVIVANRWSDELTDVVDKVYTRDLFKRD